MAAVGGDVQQISINRRLFNVAGGNDATIVKGGKDNTIEMNGNRTGRVIQKQVPWTITGLQVEIDHDKDDLGFLQQVKDSGEKVPCTIDLVDGTTYRGTGTIVDATELSTEKTTASVSLSGDGNLELQG